MRKTLLAAGAILALATGPAMAQGKPVKFGTEKGPNPITATPVLLNDRVYIANGQDPDSGGGEGALTCIDATKTGDITTTGKLWTYEGIKRSMSTASITSSSRHC